MGIYYNLLEKGKKITVVILSSIYIFIILYIGIEFSTYSSNILLITYLFTILFMIKLLYFYSKKSKGILSATSKNFIIYNTIMGIIFWDVIFFVILFLSKVI